MMAAEKAIPRLRDVGDDALAEEDVSASESFKGSRPNSGNGMNASHLRAPEAKKVDYCGG